jgi:alkanesulfonate monooxygenase SsuD/methylene tetrahydromethanopterin reductase-like flavin-dependent oxidoreductase (luciferase family)
MGVPFEERWKRFDEAVTILRGVLRGEPMPPAVRYYALPDGELAPPPRRPGGVPLWIGSWGSDAGLRRVARLGDGWLASAYNTTPEQFAAAREFLAERLRDRGRDANRFPNALVTMWTWITEDRREAKHVLDDVLAPLLNRDPAELSGRLCIGPPEEIAELLSRYAQAGCDRVYLWPLGDEARQVELAAGEVAPRIES